MEEVIKSLLSWPTILIVIIMGLYIVLYIPYIIIKTKKNNADQKKFEEENQDISKVYLKTKIGGIVSDAMYIISVDGELPHNFGQGLKGGFYAGPGKHIIEMQYTWTRPGVLYRNVTKTIGPEKVEIEIEASKKYNLSFNRDKEEFVFEEI